MRHDNLGIFNGAGSEDDKPSKRRRKFLSVDELREKQRSSGTTPEKPAEPVAELEVDERLPEGETAWRSLIMDPNRPVSGGPGITTKVELPPALVDDNFCCPVGSCKYYFELILDDPEASPEPRQWLQRICLRVQYEQGALEITDEAIVACNNYRPPWWSLEGWRMRRIVRRRLRDAARKISTTSKKRPGLSEEEEE